MAQKIIALSGGSGSGKSTLLQALKKIHSFSILCLDDYYLDRSHLSPEDRLAINYDEPKAIEVQLILAHLNKLKNNEQVAKPVYDFKTHSRVAHVPFESQDILVLDGIFSLCYERLLPLIDFGIYLDCPADIRLGRRLMRDTTIRGRTLEEAWQQYFDSVRPMHELYIEPSKKHAAIHLHYATPLDTIAKVLSPLFKL